MAYRLDLPEGSMIHPVFHISQLKPFVQDYSPDYADLPVISDLDVATAIPKAIIDHRWPRRVPRLYLRYMCLRQACLIPLQHGRITTS